MVSWNICGIGERDFKDFGEQIQIETAASAIFLQEFNSDTHASVLQSESFTYYVSPGLSKYARSNCIGIQTSLTPFYQFHFHCPIAQVVGVLIGNQGICFFNLHLPHHGHLVDIDMISDELTILFERVNKHWKSKNISCDHVCWIFGADLNEDLRDRSPRSDAIINILAQQGLKHLLPCNPTTTSHYHAASGTHSLIDWIGLSASHEALIEHHHSQNSSNIAEFLCPLVRSDHRPLYLCFDFSKLLRWDIYRAANKRGRFVLPPMKKSWKPSGEAAVAYQQSICSDLEEGQVTSIQQLNDIVGRHARASCKTAAKTHFDTLRYRDSPDLKAICAMRAASEDLHFRKQATREIHKLRKQERSAHVAWLCERVANQQWGYRGELEKLNKPRICKMPDRLIDNFGIEYPHEQGHLWHDALWQFWADVYSGKGLYCWTTAAAILHDLFVQVVALVVTLVQND